MPLVRRMVAEIFGCAEFEETRGSIRLGADYHRPHGPQLNTSQNPDEAVALGAAIQAEILVRRFQECAAAGRDAAVAGHRDLWRLDERHHPSQLDDSGEGGRDVHDGVDNQKNMLIHVLQGERERGEGQLEPGPVHDRF